MDGLDVTVNRMGADRQALGDLLFAGSLQQSSERLPLPWRQPSAASVEGRIRLDGVMLRTSQDPRELLVEELNHRDLSVREGAGPPGSIKRERRDSASPRKGARGNDMIVDADRAQMLVEVSRPIPDRVLREIA